MSTTIGACPPFRAEHIGSLLRPADLTRAFRARQHGVVSAGEFRAAQDRAIAAVVARQQAIGLAVVTDGEFRRASYWGHWVDAIAGLTLAPALFKFRDAGGGQQEFIAADCVGRLARTRPISCGEFAYLRSLTRATVKITLPSPSTLHFWRLGRTIEGSGYTSDEAYMTDLCAIFRDEIAALAALGCRYVQFDEVPLIMLGDPVIRDQVRGAGCDPDALVDLYVGALNEAVRGCPAGMTVGLHICRGNFKGRWLAAGGYEAIARRVFASVDADAFFLEYDSPRAGGFEPLREVPDGKRIVLGLVSTKVPELEDLAMLVARVDEAARYAPREQLCVSPQCGFASTVAGNRVTVADQWQKLGLVVELARRLDAGS